MEKLDQEQTTSKLENLEGWHSEAEELNHHPNWANVYNRVNVEVHSYNEGGVTGKDIELASRLNNFNLKSRNSN